MRYLIYWMSCLLCLTLWGCATSGGKHAERPAVPPLQAEDCGTHYPHDDAIADPAPAEVTLPGLAEAGKQRLALTLFDKCQYGNSTNKKAYLNALGDQLRYDQQQLGADIQAYDAAKVKVLAEVDQYKQDCMQAHLDKTQYDACTVRQKQVNLDVAQNNSTNTALQSENDQQHSRISEYNNDIVGSNAGVERDYETYEASLKALAAWLDQARNLIYSPGIDQAGCPDVTHPAKTVDQMLSMSEGIIACLEHMSGPSAPDGPAAH